MSGDDIMPTFRQKFALNNQELIFFNKEIESWQQNLKSGRNEKPSTLEDVGFALSSDDELENDAEVGHLVKGGKQCLKSGEWSRAISFYSSAASRQSGKSRHFMNRALAYLKRNMLVEAETDCSRAIDLEPGNSKAHLRRACIRKQLGKCKESCDDLEAVLTIEPGNEAIKTEYDAIVKYRLSQVLNCTENSENNELLNEKLELSSKLKLQGNELIKLENYKMANDKFTLAIQLNSHDPTYYANRAICNMKTKRFVQAEKDCTSALSLDRGYAKIYQRRARIRKSIGKLVEAREDLYSALKLRPKEADIEREIVELNKTIVDQPHPQTIQTKEHANNNSQPMEPSRNEVVHRQATKPVNSITTKIKMKRQSKNSMFDISQYDVREVFPLNMDHPSGINSGQLIKIWVEDSKFVLPEKLFEIPEKFREVCQMK